MQAIHRKACAQQRRQTGSIVINTAIALSLIVLVLVGSELGYMFLMKRDFQKTVDLAALAGAQRLVPSPGKDICKDAKDAAKVNAEANLVGVSINTPECGRWAPDTPNEDRFLPGATAYNALRVTISSDPPVKLFPFFSMNRTINVKAVAMLADSTATFSVGSQLLRTNPDTLLWKLANAVGLDATTLTVLDSKGLADIKISPSGLLEKLKLGVTLDGGVLTPTELTKLRKVTVDEILDVALGLVSHDSTLHASVSLLRGKLVDAKLSDVTLNFLGWDTGMGGLIKLNTPDPSNGAALGTQIDLGLLLKTTIGIATSTRAVFVPELDILGLVKVQAGVVEPPSIGVGGVGAKAYNAQVRLYIDIDSDNLLGGALKPLIGGLLGTHVHLPIHIDAVTGHGTITALNCQTSPPTATIKVQSSLLRACVGKSDPAIRFSDKLLCDNGLQPERLIQLLGLSKPNAATLQVEAFSDTQSLTLAEGETDSTVPNTVQIGTTVSNLVKALLNTLATLLNPSSGDSPTADRASALADAYLKETMKKGFYDAAAVVDKFKNGDPRIGDWTRDVMVPSGPLGVIYVKKTMSVWDVLHDQTTPSGTLLGALGLGPSCAGLLQALDWNNCVRGKVADALNSAPPGVVESVKDQLPNSTADGSGTSGLLSALLSPVVAILKPLLNGLGTFLSDTLAKVLGLEVGRTAVTLNSLQCGRSSLVY